MDLNELRKEVKRCGGIEVMKKHAAEAREELNDMLRLLELAKQSPFAAANSDFLRRIELELEGTNRSISSGEMVVMLIETGKIDL